MFATLDRNDQVTSMGSVEGKSLIAKQIKIARYG